MSRAVKAALFVAWAAVFRVIYVQFGFGVTMITLVATVAVVLSALLAVSAWAGRGRSR
jgi:hypothetical protein